MSVKRILDACCGSRMFWFNKTNPDALFMDIRSEEHILCDGRKLEIKPDQIGDFRSMPFPDESFYIVIFDPPHLKTAGDKSWIGKKYGILTDNWKDDLKKGFDECLRVLKPNGTLVFKWNETQIKTKDIIDLFGQDPLIGHRSGLRSGTHWMLYIKGEKI